MSLGSWDPDADKASQKLSVDVTLLQQFIAFDRNQQLEQLSKLLSPEHQQQYAPLMQMDKSLWFSLGDDLSEGELEALMRFFTIAEQLPGWQSGDNSPVIWLAKVLKKRPGGMNRELLLRIKAHTNNQYLPHGSLL